MCYYLMKYMQSKYLSCDWLYNFLYCDIVEYFRLEFYKKLFGYI